MQRPIKDRIYLLKIETRISVELLSEDHSWEKLDSKFEYHQDVGFLFFHVTLHGEGKMGFLCVLSVTQFSSVELGSSKCFLIEEHQFNGGPPADLLINQGV